jgi:hypothetical protein
MDSSDVKTSQETQDCRQDIQNKAYVWIFHTEIQVTLKPKEQSVMWWSHNLIARSPEIWDMQFRENLFIFLMAGTLIVYLWPLRPVKPFDIYIGILIMSSHKSSNSNKEEVQSVFHHFCPGLPVSLTLCPISQCGTLSQVVSVHAFTEVA